MLDYPLHSVQSQKNRIPQHLSCGKLKSHIMRIATFKHKRLFVRLRLRRARTRAILSEPGLLSVTNCSYLHTCKPVQRMHNCSSRAIHIRCTGLGQKIRLQRVHAPKHTHNFIFLSNKNTSRFQQHCYPINS